MFEQTIYGLSDPLLPQDIRYIGRTNTPDMRLRFHAFNPFKQDASPRGLWVAYLWYAKRAPIMTIIEQEAFEEKAVAEAWAKDRERYWIGVHREQSNFNLNKENWWTCPERKLIPKGIRQAWEESHNALFWFDNAAKSVHETLTAIDSHMGHVIMQRKGNSGTDSYRLMDSSKANEDHQRGRRLLLGAIRAIVSSFEQIEVSPVEMIETARIDTMDFGGWELTTRSWN